MPKKSFLFTELTEEQKSAGEKPKITGIRFDFEDKTSETFTIDDLQEDILQRAMWHGFSQKIGDSYANAGKAENPLAFAKESVRETIAQLKKGDWRAAAGESGPRVTDLAVALSRVTGKTVDECVAFLETQDDEQKKVWKKKPKIAVALAQIAAEKAQARAAKIAAEAAAKAGAEAESTEEEDESEYDIPSTETEAETQA